MTRQELTYKIRTGEIDINNQSLFISSLIKGLIHKLKQEIKIRGEVVPHFIPHTGDETMMQEIKGADVVADPLQITNENYIYTKCPRCIITPDGINMVPDQLTSPYSTGICQYESTDGTIITYRSEFRRMPLNMSFDLEYITDSYTDFLELCQQIITKLAFVRVYSIVYMGQRIDCSYQIPESLNGEHNLDFDMTTTDDRRHKLKLSVEVETNIPIFNPETIMLSDMYIKHIVTDRDSIYSINSSTGSSGDQNNPFGDYIISNQGNQNDPDINDPWSTPSEDNTPGSGNTGSGNTGSGNTGSGNTNTGSGNIGSGNTDSGNTGDTNTGSGNTGSGNTDSGNTDSGNTGSGNTGNTNTGSGNTDSGNTNTDSGNQSTDLNKSTNVKTIGLNIYPIGGISKNSNYEKV